MSKITSYLHELKSRNKIITVLLFLSIIVISTAPVVFSPLVSMTDLPNHIARHHVLFNFGHGMAIDRFFDVQWRWIGNMGIDLPVMLLMNWTDAEIATRIAIAFIAPLMVVALLALSYAAHGRVSSSAMIAMPLVFHHVYMYGFVNYSLSMALAFLVLAVWLMRPPKSWLGGVAYGLAAVAVWTAHLGGWSILLVAAGCCELARLRSFRDIGRGIGRVFPFLLPVVPLLLWRGDAGNAPLFSWTEENIVQIKILNFVTVLRGYSRIPDLLTTGAIGLLAVLALFWSGRRVDGRLLAAGLGLCLMAIVMPTTVIGSWGADFRLVPAGVILTLLSLAPCTDARRERLLFSIGLALFLARTVGIAASWHSASAVLEGRLSLLDEVPSGSRLGYIAVRSGCRYPWALDPNEHVSAFAIVRRDSFTNTMFKVEGTDLMTIRDPGDRKKWYNASEDVMALCPQGGIDRPALKQRIADMAHDDFNMIWIWGAPADEIDLPAGYRIRAVRNDDVLIGRPE